ncbi:hypothetical protein [Pseudomonas lactis]|jgi:hypothetical protein|uniref:hypothetical protein n=1 Tax=Pseudomonas lactis TaxID=1615674 RepID=UPI00110CB8C6|nr:hypothetical protein [Pseudomonas lactis]MBK3442904.1 hypothetical protein [Pseudomonas lactis]
MPNKTYTVLSGSFRRPDNSLVGQGDVVELPDDVADRFRHQLEVVVPGPSLAPAGDGGRKLKVSPDA